MAKATINPGQRGQAESKASPYTNSHVHSFCLRHSSRISSLLYRSSWNFPPQNMYPFLNPDAESNDDTGKISCTVDVYQLPET